MKNGYWLITEQGFDAVKAQYSMFSSMDDRDREDAQDIFSKQGNTAVINVFGAMQRNDDVFTEYFGITTYESIMRSIKVANDDPEIDSIVMNFDTQGGIAVGCEVAAKAISGSSKPIYGYITEACSAGYFLASQCKKLTMSELSVVGSIGTVVEVVDFSGMESAVGINRYTITSTNAPKKRFDIKSEDGQAIIKETLDTMASVFVSFVADGRGVSPSVVESDFGQGGVIIGADAVAVGMGDELGTLDQLINSLKKEQTVTIDEIKSAISALGDGEKEALMSDLAPEAKADEGEVTRVAAIMAVAQENGDLEAVNDLVAKAIEEKASIADFGKQLLDAKAMQSKAFEDAKRAQDLEEMASANNGWAQAFKK